MGLEFELVNHQHAANEEIACARFEKVLPSKSELALNTRTIDTKGAIRLIEALAGINDKYKVAMAEEVVSLRRLDR